MDAKDFRGAVLRGWRLLLLLTVLGALIGFLVTPSATTLPPLPAGFVATAIVAPSTGRGAISQGQLLLDIKNPTVLATAAAAAGVAEPADQLIATIAVTNGREALGLPKRGSHYLRLKALAITVSQPNPVTAAALANGLTTAVDQYLVGQATQKYQGDLAKAHKDFNTVEQDLAGVDNQIASGNLAGATLTAAQAQKIVLSGRLQAVYKHLVDLQLGGPAVPGYQVVRPASAAAYYAGRPAVVSIVSHRSTKVLGGALIGLLVAVIIVVLVELLDKSIRSPNAAEESFELPVIAVVPLREARRPALQRPPPEARLDVVTDPGSAVAEAYRRLHTAVLLEPLATDLALMTNGNGRANGHHYGANQIGSRWTPEAVAVDPMAPAYGVGTTGDGGEHGNGGNGGGNGYGNGNGNGRSRQVVLVVSPGVEPTRSLVVANLAAVYAEAGGRALVINIGNLDWRRSASAPPVAWHEGVIDPDDLLPLSTPSPVEGVSRLRFDQVLESRGQVVAQGPAIISAARQVADAVLVEAPPLLLAHDALALLPAVDVVLVVAQYAMTRIDDARESTALLRRFRAPVLGVVLTNVPRKGKDLRRARRELDYRPGPSLVPPEEMPTEPVPVDSAPTGKLWL